MSWQGVAVSDGTAIGKVLKLEVLDLDPKQDKINDSQVEAEKQKFSEAVKQAALDLQQLVEAKKGTESAEIFGAHLSILDDPFLEETVLENIKNNHNNVEMALCLGTKDIAEQFLAIDDEYIRERVADIRDVSGRIMRILKGVTEVNLSEIQDEVIIVAKDLTPSQTATMNVEKILGFITDLGGRTSHTAIMARSMEIPAIVGCNELFDKISDDDFVVMDGAKGNIIVNPSEDEISTFTTKREAEQVEKARLRELKDVEPKTTDGHLVEVCANAGGVADVKRAVLNGVDGVGLFRTEFLYMDSSDFPTEEEQFQVYKEAAETLEGKAIIIRTLDIGGDKSLTYYEFDEELNPFLGYRAIRLCLDRHDIFKVQLRAILRASAFGKIRIMYPMVISLEEIQACNEILDTCKKELDAEGASYDKKIEVGIMIETPAAVWMADVLANHVDFFSIGTNDLTQYTLAVDRGNEKIQKLYNSFHPAVLRSINHVIKASHDAGKWTGMCGEFAGDPKAIPVLLGMGLDEFSMSSSSVLRAKEIVLNSNYAECQKLWEEVSGLTTAVDVEHRLEN